MVVSDDQRAIRVAVVGVGKFAAMFLGRVPYLPWVHVVGVADLRVDSARETLRKVGWSDSLLGGRSVEDAWCKGLTFVTDDSESLIGSSAIDLLVEATGSPTAAVRHALLAFERGRDVIMVTVEADALAGPILARRAREAGAIYSLAYGDQPSLICELVEWARTCGLSVVCAGKGTRFLPSFHASTPDTVWANYGWSDEQAAAAGANPAMFNSFVDGTKSAIEMAAVANATGLKPQLEGLQFPPCGTDELASVMRPKPHGGVLTSSPTLEVASSLRRDGSPVPHDLRWGVFVVFSSDDAYSRQCLREYAIPTDESGAYGALHRPYHLIGLELPISVHSVGVRRRPTGVPAAFVADVVCVAKRDLAAGTVLDGEGGYCVYGKLSDSGSALAQRAFPIGLAHGRRLKSNIAAGEILRWDDVEVDEGEPAVALRRAAEAELLSECASAT
jgi:predicted homoserine dehydrogenase-like protein